MCACVSVWVCEGLCHLGEDGEGPDVCGKPKRREKTQGHKLCVSCLAKEQKTSMCFLDRVSRL